MKIVRWLWVVPLLVVVFHGVFDQVQSDQLQLEVNNWSVLPFFETPRTYAYLHLFSFLPVLFLSFDRKVHYYKEWKFLWPGVLLVGTIFIVWDVWFTHLGVWGFNSRYYLGLAFLGLPVEEWLFFVVIPFCCVFIYECVGAYLDISFWKKNHRTIIIVLLVLLGLTIPLRWGALYTVTTFGLTVALLLFSLFFVEKRILAQFCLSFLISCVPFLLVNGVLTGGFTTQPVVMYNPEEYFGWRIGAIPLDDLCYSFLLLLSNILCFEYCRKKSLKK